MIVRSLLTLAHSCNQFKDVFITSRWMEFTFNRWTLIICMVYPFKI
jgi:hypothetical protein